MGDVFVDQLPLKLGNPLLVVVLGWVEAATAGDANIGKLLKALNLYPQFSEETESFVVILDREIHDALSPLQGPHRQNRAYVVAVLESENTDSDRISPEDIFWETGQDWVIVINVVSKRIWSQVSH